MRYILFAAALTLGACAQQPVYRTTSTPLPVAQIEIEPYLGLWYEQARLPNSFERGCASATAEYGLREDGLISVLNTCFEQNGEQREANGRARVVGENGEGKLKVSFFGPFWGDYWVVERAEDYAWSIVSEPSGKYLWILTRAETISPQDRAVFEARVQALGYQPADLAWAAR
jgi:apolipoprotein D and lipocalin family protein